MFVTSLNTIKDCTIPPSWLNSAKPPRAVSATFGDNVALTALGGLALFNQLGGIVQSLMVFKDVTNIYQVTGDSALSNLSVNALNITTGTLAPNTIVATPKGLAFMAPDGVRLINFDAKIEDPIGFDGMGVSAPFISS